MRLPDLEAPGAPRPWSAGPRGACVLETTGSAGPLRAPKQPHRALAARLGAPVERV